MKVRKVHTYLFSSSSSRGLIENIKASVILVVLSFIPFKYFTQRGYSESVGRLFAGTFFVLGFVVYFLVLDTDIYFFRRFLTAIVSRLSRAYILIYALITSSMLLSLTYFYLNKDFLLLSNPAYLAVLLFSFLIGIHLGILFTSNNLAKLWDQGLLYTLIIFLVCNCFIVFLIYLYNQTIQGPLLRGSVLVTLTTFLLIHLFIKRLIARVILLEKNLLDMEKSRAEGRATLMYNWIRDGKIWRVRTVRFLNSLLGNVLLKISRRESCKIKCRILYRRKKFDAVIETATEFLKKDKSNVLVSLKALSYMQKGEPELAFDVLLKARKADLARGEADQSPYFPLNIGYLYWQKGDIDQAIEYSDQAVKIDPHCPMALNNKAFFIAEKARLDFASERSEERLNESLQKASELIRKAFESVDKYCFATLRDTEAYIHLLRGDLETAKDIFLQTAVARVASRVHLAIIYMKGSQIYERSECYLRRALSQLGRNTRNRYYKFAQHLLVLIRNARREGIVFNEEIVFYYNRNLHEIPPTAMTYAKQRQIVGLLTQVRPLTLFANVLSRKFWPRTPMKHETICRLPVT